MQRRAGLNPVFIHGPRGIRGQFDSCLPPTIIAANTNHPGLVTAQRRPAVRFAASPGCDFALDSIPLCGLVLAPDFGPV